MNENFSGHFNFSKSIIVTLKNLQNENLLIIVALLMSNFGFSQTKMTPEQAKKKAMEMMGKQGTLAFEISDGNKGNVNASLIHAKDRYTIMSFGGVGDLDKTRVVLSVDAISEGEHKFSDTYKNAS